MPTTLPETPFTLQGGCFCASIRYKISIPALSSRPLIPHDPKKEITPPNKVTSRLPIISLDHCTSCRRIAGSIVESWFICPQAWVQFELQLREEEEEEEEEKGISTSSKLGMGDATTSLKENTIRPTMKEYLLPNPSLQSQTHLKHFSSSPSVHRTFCGKCGTHLTYFCDDETPPPGREHWGPVFDIATGTMDRGCLEMDGFRPFRYGWVDDGIGWVRRLLELGKGSLDE